MFVIYVVSDIYYLCHIYSFIIIIIITILTSHHLILVTYRIFQLSLSALSLLVVSLSLVPKWIQ